MTNKMYDSWKIITGLVIFVALITFPVWYNLASGKGSYVPEPAITTTEKKCVADKEYMRSFHMDMLNQWRDKVVREGNRTHVSPDGKKFDMSLSRTCMKCHTSRKDFCTTCHDYAGVKPYCWDCHVEPEVAK
ncbi:sulfate reduction electron transfer complex DsrMKJOP subunit DsrJ [Elusimicrobiota bacterium]